MAGGAAPLSEWPVAQGLKTAFGAIGAKWRPELKSRVQTIRAGKQMAKDFGVWAVNGGVSVCLSGRLPAGARISRTEEPFNTIGCREVRRRPRRGSPCAPFTGTITWESSKHGNDGRQGRPAGDGTTATKAKGFLIGYQILVAMLVIALIPLAGLYYISISKARADWSANILHNLTITTSGLARSVEEWTTMNFLLLQQVSATPAMKSMEASQQNPVLATISRTYPWIYLAHTIQLDGNNAGRSDGKATTFYGDRDYVKKVVSGEPVAQEVVIGKTSKKPALILAVPIMGDASRTLGVASTAMSLEDLSKTVTSTRIGTSGYVILVDERNRLIAHGKGEISSELQDFSSHPGLRKQNEMIIHKDEGKQVIAYSKKTRQGWTLLVQQDYDEAYAAADKARMNALDLTRRHPAVRRRCSLLPGGAAGHADSAAHGCRRRDQLWQT